MAMANHENNKPKQFQGSSRYTCFFGTDDYGFQESRVQMVRGYGFHIIAAENGRFRRNAVCCGPVYGSWSSLRFCYGPVQDSRFSLRVGFDPVCTQQHLSSGTAKPPMPSTLGMYSPLRTDSSIFRHPPSPQQPPLVPIAHPGRIAFVDLAAPQ